VGSLCGEGARETVEKQMVENHHLLRNGAGRIAKAAAEAFMIAAKSYNGDLEGFARYMERSQRSYYPRDLQQCLCQMLYHM
jgi:hypothetical protein